jgi:WD40 repeat protein
MFRTTNPLRARWTYFAAALLIAVGASALWAVGTTARTVQAQQFPQGAWEVASRAEGEVLLSRKPVTHRGARSAAGPPTTTRRPQPPEHAIETVVWSRGKVVARQIAEVIRLTIPVSGQNLQLLVRSARFRGRQVLFNAAGDGPRLLPSPTDADTYIFAHSDHLWRLSRGGTPQPVTRDAVHGFDRQRLREQAQQREGVYLIWAAAPMWSPDGRMVAYVTNRQTIAAKATGGQSIWIVDPRTGAERPLLEGRETWFAPIGWLGAELLFATEGRMIGAVNPTTGKRREVARGVAIAVSDAGNRAAIGEWSQPGNVRVSILVGGERVAVPSAPRGYSYRGFAAFSPSGGSLLLMAGANDGRRRLVIFDIAARSASQINLPRVPTGMMPTDPPQWLDERTLLVNVMENSTRQEHAVILRPGVQ